MMCSMGVLIDKFLVHWLMQIEVFVSAARALFFCELFEAEFTYLFHKQFYHGQTKPVQGKRFFKFQPQSKTKIILKPGNNCNSNNIYGVPYFYEHSLGAKIILNHGNNSNLSYIFGAPHFYEQCSDAKEFMVNNFIITWCLVKTIISIVTYLTYKSMTKTKSLYYKMIKLSLQGKFCYKYTGFVKTKFWKRKRHIEAFNSKIRNMMIIIKSIRSNTLCSGFY